MPIPAVLAAALLPCLAPSPQGTQTGFQHVAVVRAAQQAVIADQPSCAAVDTTGMALQADRVHFATEGVMSLGSALAAGLRQFDRR